MARFPPELCFCGKCGAKPGQPCRTSGGNRTTFHRSRTTGEEEAPSLRRQATRLECWRTGFRAGVIGFPQVNIQEFAEQFLAPEDWLKGF